MDLSFETGTVITACVYQGTDRNEAAFTYEYLIAYRNRGTPISTLTGIKNDVRVDAVCFNLGDTPANNHGLNYKVEIRGTIV